MRRHVPLALAALGLGATFHVALAADPPITASPKGRHGAGEVVQEFAFRGQPATAWKVRYEFAMHEGLAITGAWFRRAPAEPWIQILGDLRLTEMFVPYHTGDPRLYDMTSHGGDIVAATADDAGPAGAILDGCVVKEIRDTGIEWRSRDESRRGAALVLWSTVSAGNYEYVIHYTFRDEGTIDFAVGSTAQNYPGREGVAHSHLGLWHVDLDLDGPDHDRVEVMRHQELPTLPGARDLCEAFNGGVEGALDWTPAEYTMVRVSDLARKNARGHALSYDVMVHREGIARCREPFTAHDLLATAWHEGEMAFVKADSYARDKERVDDANVVLWIATALHHEPRDEDGGFVDGRWIGAAHVMWSGGTLRPRSLFDGTPLFDAKGPKDAKPGPGTRTE